VTGTIAGPQIQCVCVVV